MPPEALFLRKRAIERKSPVGDIKKNYYWEQWAGGGTFPIEKGRSAESCPPGTKAGREGMPPEEGTAGRHFVRK